MQWFRVRVRVRARARVRLRVRVSVSVSVSVRVTVTVRVRVSVSCAFSEAFCRNSCCRNSRLYPLALWLFGPCIIVSLVSPPLQNSKGNPVSGVVKYTGVGKLMLFD